MSRLVVAGSSAYLNGRSQKIFIRRWGLEFQSNGLKASDIGIIDAIIFCGGRPEIFAYPQAKLRQIIIGRIMMMINQIYYHHMQTASNLRSSNVSNPASSSRFPLEYVLQPIDPVFN